jgi:hypothetical protein
VGVDGPAPAPVVPATIPIPYVIPSRNPATGSPFGVLNGKGFDPDYTVGRSHMVNLTIQRETVGGLLIEAGFLGRFGRSLPAPVDINAPPTFIKDMSGKSSQTFAQAFDGVATELRAGVAPKAVTAQAWFENNLGAGATQTLASAASSNFVSNQVATLVVSQIDLDLMRAGISPLNNQQFQTLVFFSDVGFSNYAALFGSLRTRMAHGLSFNLNYTWSHYLDNGGAPQNQGLAVSNPFRPGYDYGDAWSDRRHTLSLYGTYELPFWRRNRIFGGWQTSFILSAASGLPLLVFESGQEFGFGGQAGAPAIAGLDYREGKHFDVSGSGGVGTAGDPAVGGTGVNLFANPQAVLANFRPVLIGTDTQTSRGILRSFGFWNLDFSIGKSTRLYERLRVTVSADAFNLTNTVLFRDPNSNLFSRANFGVVTSQSGNPGSGDFSGPRRIQLGLRFDF